MLREGAGNMFILATDYNYKVITPLTILISTIATILVKVFFFRKYRNYFK